MPAAFRGKLDGTAQTHSSMKAWTYSLQSSTLKLLFKRRYTMSKFLKGPAKPSKRDNHRSPAKGGKDLHSPGSLEPSYR